MELFWNVVLLVLGLALLIKGADWFVDGSAGIAGKCRIPPLIIGLTVVAFGTSAPELCVSVASAIRKSTEIAIGNVVGSNVANVLLILGISALIHNLPVTRDSLVLDLPVLLFSSALLIGLGVWGRALDWWDGLILLSVFVAYMSVLLVKARRVLKRQKEVPMPEGSAAERTEPHEEGKIARWFALMKRRLWFLIVLTAVGLGMVVGGGTLLVNSAEAIAEYFHASERIIALTVVAIGTSLPELVTSVVAAKKGETDIAVGNVIGSNIFNILLIAGISSLVYPLPFEPSRNLVDALAALAAVVLLYALALFKGHKIGKFGGAVMLGCFVGYYAYLFVA
ncbi:MAG: calcium/sodium antiporter [Clostridia bacterium]|nr:calcium/sodium antiporter [Clostridia bacterium]